MHIELSLIVASLEKLFGHNLENLCDWVDSLGGHAFPIDMES